MRILNQLRAWAGAIPRASVRRYARRFVNATQDCRASQAAVLKELIALNGDSRFSDENGLRDVRNPADLRKRLPVTNYEFYRDRIEQMKQGDHGALLGSANRLLMFSLSSGTTANSKFIPITERFLNDYRRGWQTWGIRTLDDHCSINAGHILQLTSDYDRFRTPGGTPCGNISGLVAAMQKRIVKTMYTVPGCVSKIGDTEAKNYVTLRLALADNDVAMVMTANPSTLIHLAKLAESHFGELVRDIADGTLSPDYDVPSAVRDQLRRRLSRRNKGRAQSLERWFHNSGSLQPKDYWKNLAIVGVWTGGSAGSYLHSLRHYYGETPIRDHGLSASEGRMTIPLRDEESAGVLEVDTHYFEFIPEEEYESPQPTILEAHELQEGRNYFILLTTSSGFYRYDICDVVRCTGFFHTTPKLEFLHKGAHISNITGEKISESQVVTAVKDCIRRMDVDLKHFTVSPVWGDPPHYQLIVEGRDFGTPDVLGRFVNGVDEQLQRINCEYAEKRQSGRLKTMTSFPLPDGAWQEFIRRRQQKLGGSQEQYKHPCLVPDLKFSDELVRESIPAAV